ncbi:MAG TPA: MbcA/ParS/Xre antitoxin family protein [Gammaproteobacteria bacterium]|nr:MbcA/ParS/Xre antitoxin family protein [Gammaproteobacteria bacterium]HRA42562.1 MbcA/ParS/Xre antitoxin family protein [Gammaproteobacteria bacterium]
MKPLKVLPSNIDPVKLQAAALQAFFNITKNWGLNAEEEQILLGSPPRSTFFKWKKEKQGHLSCDTLDRISYLLGIYKALQILLPNEHAANEWIKKPNSAPLFNGRSALDKMLAGKVIDLADVRRYLDAERGG